MHESCQQIFKQKPYWGLEPPQQRALRRLDPTSKRRLVPLLIDTIEAGQNVLSGGYKSNFYKQKAADALLYVSSPEAREAVPLLEQEVQKAYDDLNEALMIQTTMIVSLLMIDPGNRHGLAALRRNLLRAMKDGETVRTAFDPYDVNFPKLDASTVMPVLIDLAQEDTRLLESYPEMRLVLAYICRSDVSSLVDALGSPKPFTRSLAIAALIPLGPDARRAIPALLQVALHNPELELRSDAIHALARIGGRPALLRFQETARQEGTLHEETRSAIEILLNDLFWNPPSNMIGYLTGWGEE